MRRTITGFTLAMLVLAAGCGSGGQGKTLECVSDEPKTIKTGVLVVGSDLAFAPMESIDPQTQQPVGFDVDLITEIAKRMEMKVEFVNQTFSGIITALVAKKFDVIASSMTITDEREEQICMGDEYFEADQSLVVKSADIKSTADLTGKTVAVQAGTTGEDWAQKNLATKQVTVKAFETADDAFLDLKSDKVQGVIIDIPVGLYRQKTDPELRVAEEILTDEVYGFAVHPDNGALVDEIDLELEEVEKEGLYDTLYEKWFGRKP